MTDPGEAELLRGLGVDAPAVGDLADADAATLLGRCADLDPETRQDELRAWCEARGAAWQPPSWSPSSSGPTTPRSLM